MKQRTGLERETKRQRVPVRKHVKSTQCPRSPSFLPLATRSIQRGIQLISSGGGGGGNIIIDEDGGGCIDNGSHGYATN